MQRYSLITVTQALPEDIHMPLIDRISVSENHKINHKIIIIKITLYSCDKSVNSMCAE